MYATFVSFRRSLVRIQLPLPSKRKGTTSKLCLFGLCLDLYHRHFLKLVHGLELYLGRTADGAFIRRLTLHSVAAHLANVEGFIL